MSEIIQTVNNRRCGHCRETGHNIRSCEKRKKDVNKLDSRVDELINEIEEYKQESFRKRQIISTLLISQSYLERKTAYQYNVISHMMDNILKEKQKKVINNNTFAVNTMKELLIKANEECDICYNKYNFDNIVIKSCWHKCCTTCNEQLDKCHVCRQ